MAQPGILEVDESLQGDRDSNRKSPVEDKNGPGDTLTSDALASTAHTSLMPTS